MHPLFGDLIVVVSIEPPPAEEERRLLVAPRRGYRPAMTRAAALYRQRHGILD